MNINRVVKDLRYGHNSLKAIALDLKGRLRYQIFGRIEGKDPLYKINAFDNRQQPSVVLRFDPSSYWDRFVTDLGFGHEKFIPKLLNSPGQWKMYQQIVPVYGEGERNGWNMYLGYEPEIFKSSLRAIPGRLRGDKNGQAIKLGEEPQGSVLTFNGSIVLNSFRDPDMQFEFVTDLWAAEVARKAWHERLGSRLSWIFWNKGLNTTTYLPVREAERLFGVRPESFEFGHNEETKQIFDILSDASKNTSGENRNGLGPTDGWKTPTLRESMVNNFFALGWLGAGLTVILVAAYVVNKLLKVFSKNVKSLVYINALIYDRLLEELNKVISDTAVAQVLAEEIIQNRKKNGYFVSARQAKSFITDLVLGGLSETIKKQLARKLTIETAVPHEYTDGRGEVREFRKLSEKLLGWIPGLFKNNSAHDAENIKAPQAKLSLQEFKRQLEHSVHSQDDLKVLLNSAFPNDSLSENLKTAILRMVDSGDLDVLTIEKLKTVAGNILQDISANEEMKNAIRVVYGDAALPEEVFWYRVFMEKLVV